MLSYKDWKSLNESYDFSLGLATPKSLGVMGGSASFEEIIEAKKMKKKMDLDGEDEESDDSEEDNDEEDDAETGDGEVVDPSSPKDDADSDDEGSDDESEGDESDDEESDDGEDKEMSPAVMMMKKKMKNKMASKCKEKKKCSKMKKKMTSEDATWWQSVHDMVGVPENNRHFDGVTYGEDSLLPVIDPNTGLTANSPPMPGDVGFSPETRFGLGS